MVYRLSSSATLEAPISTSSSAPRGSRGNELLISRLDRPATSDEAEPTYAVRVVSDTVSTALDEPEQHLQTIRFASPLGSFWLRSALGTSRPNAARAVQNGALCEQKQPPIPWPDRSDVEGGGSLQRVHGLNVGWVNGSGPTRLWGGLEAHWGQFE